MGVPSWYWNIVIGIIAVVVSLHGVIVIIMLLVDTKGPITQFLDKDEQRQCSHKQVGSQAIQ